MLQGRKKVLDRSTCLKDGGVLGSQRPEIHQLQMPNDLHPRSPRISSCGSLFPWDLTAQMGQDGHWADPPASSATLPGMRHKTRRGEIPPHCGGPAPPSCPRLLIFRLTLYNHVAVGLGLPAYGHVSLP